MHVFHYEEVSMFKIKSIKCLRQIIIINLFKVSLTTFSK